MKRRDFDSDDGRQSQEENGPLPCHKCRRPTQRATLANYGAQCFACYEAYRLEPQTYVDVGDKRVDRLGWAKALERRHRQPNHGLTPPQIAMYRHALAGRQIDDEPPTSADSRRVDEAKRAAAARVAQYLRDHPELQP
jgi:hypothetical protein